LQSSYKYNFIKGKNNLMKGDCFMSKKNFIAALSLFLVLGVASFALAGDGSSTATGVGILFGAIAIGCGLGIGLAALGTGIGMGTAINAALTGIARNPEVTGKIQINMILGLALIESLCIYALVIALIMVIKVPDLETVIKSLVG
jgi:F-type H+-transporting ATPase subunit c